MPSNELPDFNDLYLVAEEIAKWTKEKAVLEIHIKLSEAEITRLARSDPQYFVDGKKPALNMIQTTIAYTGFNNDLIPKRMELAEAESQLIRYKHKLDIMKAQIEVWRTESANERKLV